MTLRAGWSSYDRRAHFGWSYGWRFCRSYTNLLELFLFWAAALYFTMSLFAWSMLRMLERFLDGFLYLRLDGLWHSSASPLEDCSAAEELLEIDSFSSMHSLSKDSSESLNWSTSEILD